MNDAAAVQNHNGAAFNQVNDPNMAGSTMLDPNSFINNPSNAFVDPSQFQNQQIQRMQNGAMRNPSPSFSSPVYQTNSVVPLKRPRPREDSMASSPRQQAGMLPTSRSQTPQQNFTSFNGTASSASQHAPQPTPYAHLQHGGSANASPSPVMSNQLRTASVPQRVSTASPHPFSPAAGQQFAPSPSHSDHTSRGDTPQSQFIQGQGMASGYPQQFTGMQSRTAAPTQSGTMSMPQMQQMQQQQMQPPHMFAGGQQSLPNQQQQSQQLDQTKMMYQMQLQQQSRMMNAQAQRMQMQQTPNMANKPQMPQANGPYGPGQRPPQPLLSRAQNPEQFMRSLSQFMAGNGLPLDPNPIVGDRSVSLIMIYMAVAKFGGYRTVTTRNLWGQVAQALQFNPLQYQNVPQQLRGHYERNLLKFDEALSSQQQRQKMMQQNANASVSSQGQMSPVKPMNMQVMGQQPQFMPLANQSPMPARQSPHMAMTGQGQGTPMKHISQPGLGNVANGFSTPQIPNQLQGSAHAHSRSMSHSVEPAPVMNGSQFGASSPAPEGKSGSASLQAPDGLLNGEEQVVNGKKRKRTAYDPQALPMTTWGGINPDQLQEACFDLNNVRPNIPSVPELGLIDVHALTMSLQSGIHSEVRLALDTLATVTVETRIQLDLRGCEDLVDSIIDCAEEQLDLLAENAAEVSDVMLVNSYEEVTRSCRIERLALQDVPKYGTLDYELDRAVERLICITTILRNLSFYETNHAALSDKTVVVFLCAIIRHLGTRHMLVRTHSNTLDLMKDLIIILSNLTQVVEIPGKEQALCLLHFLLAFAPCPPPLHPGGDKIIFSPYDPAIHRYLPPAVDSLAKLLARDEPNRTYYKKIFASEAASSPPYDLLTKSFALAISPIPGNKQDLHRVGMMQTVDSRKPHLMQGMLAAEILSNLVPGYESGVTRSWLTSEDGFAQSLLRLITVLSTEPSSAGNSRGVPSAARQLEDEALLHITLSGITVLRRLFEKSRNPDDPSSIVPTDGMIKQENLLGALMLKPPTQPRPEVIRQLCVYAKLDM